MKNIQDMKKRLNKAEATEPEKVDSLLVDIARVKEEAENAIKQQMRDVDFKTKEYTVELIINKYREGLEDDTNELFIPDYQREFKWDKVRQSKLIESIFIGLPIPFIFTADVHSDDEELDGRIEIVDGSQRIRTLDAFVNGGLVLENLKLLEPLNSFTFEDLPLSRQRRFLRTPIRVIELSEKSDERTRKDLWERINSGSLDLVAQEKRKGSNLVASDFYRNVIERCAHNEKLKKLAPVSSAKEGSGEYEELTLRFFAYYEQSSSYNGEVQNFLNDYLEAKLKNNDSNKDNKLVELFEQMLNVVEMYFENGFKKTSNAKSTPRARFEAISVGIAFALKEKPNLTFAKNDISTWLSSEEFKKATTSDGGNNVGNFNHRINFVKNKLLGV